MAVTKPMLIAFILVDLALIGAAMWWFVGRQTATDSVAQAVAAPVRIIASMKEFDGALTSATSTVLIDFNSEACPPCKLLSPILENFAREHAQTVTVFSVDVVQVPDLAKRFQSDDLPLVVRLDHGAETARFTGMKSASELAMWMAGAKTR